MDEGRSVESSKVRPIIRTVVAVLLFLFYMFPFFMIVLNSFKDKRDITKLPLSFGGKKGFTIDNYITAFQRLDFLNVFKNSFLVTGISVLLIILFSSMCAYIFVRKDWKINKLLFLLMMFSMVIPFQVVMIPLISIYGGMFHLLNHRYTLSCIWAFLSQWRYSCIMALSREVFLWHWRRRRTLMVQARSGHISPSYFHC